MKEGPRKEDIAGARADVARAQAAVKTAEANRLELQRKEQELVAAQSRNRADRRRRWEFRESQLADTEIYTPIDGVVLVKSAEAGRGAGRGNDRRDHRRSGASLAARLHQ